MTFEENLDFPFGLRRRMDMRPECFIASFADAQHHPWLTFNDTKVARRHKTLTAVLHHHNAAIGETSEVQAICNSNPLFD